jgi:hypothetical protein
VSSTSAAAAAFCFEVGAPLGAGDRHDVVALCQHPGERELGGRDALLLRDLGDLLGDPPVGLEVLADEARVVAPEVSGVELVGRAEPSR